VLLSDPAIEKLLREDFVPSWESVHETAQVTIDFADGKSLKRTIGGNTVIYLCRADGAVIDAFPGIYTKHDFLAEAKSAIDMLQSGLAFATDPRIARIHADKVRYLLPNAVTSISKSVLESPVLLQLNVLGGHAPLRDLSKEPRPAQGAQWISRPKVNVRKESPKQYGATLIQSDSANNRVTVRPHVHFLLSKLTKAATPSECKVPIYEGILGTKLDDPYLGLTEAELPGTRGLITR
tara:strand:- start:2393 stop:3103 length:711 start_codon:yes stop_codon:yes gene_type:complete